MIHYIFPFLSSLLPPKELFDQPSSSCLSADLWAYTRPLRHSALNSQNESLKVQTPPITPLLKTLKLLQFAQRKSCNQFPERPSTISLPLTLFPSLSALAGALLFLLLETLFPQISAVPSFNFSSLSFMATSLVTRLPGYLCKTQHISHPLFVILPLFFSVAFI